jgi:carbon monoxide dehydrogenase subunit G
LDTGITGYPMIMTSVQRTFEVTAAPAEVLAYLSDFAHTEEWDPATQRPVRLDDGPIGPGATWRNTSRVFGHSSDITYTLRERTDDVLVFVGENDTLTSTDTIRVRPAGDGSEIDYHVDLDLHGLATLAAPAMKLEFEKLAHDTEKQMTEVLNELGRAT